MRRRTTARGTALTELGFGASQLGNLYRETTDEESTRAVDAAWEGGVRYFDTAPHYGLGLSERRIGAALKGRPRGEYTLSTKVGRLLMPSPETANQQDDDGFVVPAAYRRVFDFSRDGILRSIESSLERLGVDYLDIAYLHDPDEHWEAASTSGIDALVELRDQGIVRAIGAGMNQSAMLTRFVRETDVDVAMVAGRLTLLDQSALGDLLPAAAEKGVSIVAAGVYNSGILSSNVVDIDAKFDYSLAPEPVLRRARQIAEICGEHGVTLPQVAVQYPLRWPQVVSVVLGTRTAEQARSGVERVSATVPDDLWQALIELGLLDA